MHEYRRTMKAYIWLNKTEAVLSKRSNDRICKTNCRRQRLIDNYRLISTSSALLMERRKLQDPKILRHAEGQAVRAGGLRYYRYLCHCSGSILNKRLVSQPLLTSSIADACRRRHCFMSKQVCSSDEGPSGLTETHRCLRFSAWLKCCRAHDPTNRAVVVRIIQAQVTRLRNAHEAIAPSRFTNSELRTLQERSFQWQRIDKELTFFNLEGSLRLDVSSSSRVAMSSWGRNLGSMFV